MPARWAWPDVRLHRGRGTDLRREAALVVDPSEEKIQTEFAGVKRTYLPLHSVIRIDEVRKSGVSKVPRSRAATWRSSRSRCTRRRAAPARAKNRAAAGGYASALAASHRSGIIRGSLLNGGRPRSCSHSAALPRSRISVSRSSCAALRERVAQRQAIDTRFLHFVGRAAPLTAADTGVLERSAALRSARPHAGEPDGEMLLVLPRFGTVSPWSSKATDIAHNCGLAKVARIERGVAYYIAARDRAALGALAPRTRPRDPRPHDRDRGRRPVAAAARLFAHHAPQPLATVTVLGAAGARRSSAPTPSWASRSRPTRSTTSSRTSAKLGARPDRRRADDVRAGELRALPPQDLQRHVDRRRRARRTSRCSR